MRKTQIATIALSLAALAGCSTAVASHPASHPAASSSSSSSEGAVPEEGSVPAAVRSAGAVPEYPGAAAGIVTSDGYAPTWALAGSSLSVVQQRLGDESLATGTEGTSAEQVIVYSGHNSCQVPAQCTPDYFASEIPQVDPGTHASASGLVLRITGTIAVFRADGIPGMPTA